MKTFSCLGFSALTGIQALRFCLKRHPVLVQEKSSRSHDKSQAAIVVPSILPTCFCFPNHFLPREHAQSDMKPPRTHDCAAPAQKQGPVVARQQGGLAFYSLLTMDALLLVIFSAEYFLKGRALGMAYMCSLLGILDMILLLSASAYLTLSVAEIHINGALLGLVRAARLLRILRLVHLLQILPALALLVKGLVSTMITIMDAMILLCILSYIGALICSEILGNDNEVLRGFFGSISTSFLTHIKLVLVEGWPQIAAAMLGDSNMWAAYLFVFICLSNFALLNLVTGVVCERVMELARQLPPPSAVEKDFEFQMLRSRICELYTAHRKPKRNWLTEAETARLFQSALASELMDDMKVALPSQSKQLRSLLDEDGDGKVTCEELQDSLMKMRCSRFDQVSREMQRSVRLTAGKGQAPWLYQCLNHGLVGLRKCWQFPQPSACALIW